MRKQQQKLDQKKIAKNNMNRKEAYELGITRLTEVGIEEAKSDTLLLLDGI